jgi:hypothetical protein
VDLDHLVWRVTVPVSGPFSFSQLGHKFTFWSDKKEWQPFVTNPKITTIEIRANRLVVVAAVVLPAHPTVKFDEL